MLTPASLDAPSPEGAPELAPEAERRIRGALSALSLAIQAESFVLFGGAAVDLARDPTATPLDWDIAVVDSAAAAKVCVRLEQAGYEPRHARSYRLNDRVTCENVAVTIPPWGCFDLSFIDSVERIGIFDLESLHVTYPAVRIVDRYDALGGMRRRFVRFIRDALHAENPYVMLKRLLNLTAKYRLALMPPSENHRVVTTLMALFHHRDPQANVIYAGADVAGCLSKLLGGVFRAPDPAAYLRDTLASGLIDVAFPSLAPVLRGPQVAPRILTTRNKRELVALLLAAAPTPQVRQALASLGSRTWDESDACLVGSPLFRVTTSEERS